MSIHISAKKRDLAETVLLPGDPLRAEWIAKEFLENPVRYNSVRNMLGFTGTVDGKPISVQGSGMGMPSLSIYVNELIKEYGVKKIIRVGSCGSFRKEIGLGSLIVAIASCSDSNINKRRFDGMDFAPIANPKLLFRAYRLAKSFKTSINFGNILSSDLFDNDVNPEEWKKWAKYGVLAVEMETAELYTLAAKFGIQALTVLTVSDVIPTGEKLAPKKRQNSFGAMIELALKL